MALQVCAHIDGITDVKQPRQPNVVNVGCTVIRMTRLQSIKNWFHAKAQN